MKRRQVKKESKKVLNSVKSLDAICKELAERGIHTAFISFNFFGGKYELSNAQHTYVVTTENTYILN